MKIEQAHEATEELLAAIHRLLPQLTEARTPPTLEQLDETVKGQTMLVARSDEDGEIIGTLTLIMYRVSSGLKGRIEDVIVDNSARGQGVGEALTREGMARANAGPRPDARADVDALPRVREPPLQAPRLRPQAHERLRLVAQIAATVRSGRVRCQVMETKVSQPVLPGSTTAKKACKSWATFRPRPVPGTGFLNCRSDPGRDVRRGR